MTKEEKIKELEKQENILYEKLEKLREEKKNLQLEGLDYTGKYIHIKEWGYIHVSWQVLETKEKSMFFQGPYFISSLSPYQDDFYFEFDALKDLHIPLGIFLDLVKLNEIKELSREEFLEEYKNQKEKFENQSKEMFTKILK